MLNSIEKKYPLRAFGSRLAHLDKAADSRVSTGSESALPHHGASGWNTSAVRSRRSDNVGCREACGGSFLPSHSNPAITTPPPLPTHTRAALSSQTSAPPFPLNVRLAPDSGVVCCADTPTYGSGDFFRTLDHELHTGQREVSHSKTIFKFSEVQKSVSDVLEDPYGSVWSFLMV